LFLRRSAIMQFNYTVKTKQGETQTGAIEANNSRAALEALHARNLIVLNLEPASQTPLFARRLKFLERVKIREVVIFNRQLATLVSAQVPLLTALQALAKQTDNEYFQNVILEVSADVEGGAVLSRALARHPKVFSVFTVNMIKSGEASGNLESSLSYLADYLEKQQHLMSRVKNSMTYPGFILAAFTIVGALMMILVVPKLTAFLGESGQELPPLTKIIVGLALFLKGWWWLLLIILVGGGWYLYYLVQNSPLARYRWDAIKLKLPIFGKKIFQKMYVTRIAENLSTLIQGGLSILQALQVTADIVGNAVFQRIMNEAKEEVRVGNSLSGSLAKHKEIPPLVVQMIATGEQTGSLDVILKKMAQFYSREIDITVDNLSQLIEPLLIFLIGGAVAILMVAILMPIYNIAGGM